MHSRGSYQIVNTEEGKAAQRDQSYRSCVLTLLIFFFLCIILILAGLLWKRKEVQHPVQQGDNRGTAEHIHNDIHPTRMTSTSRVSTTRSTEDDLTRVISTEPTEPERVSKFKTVTQNSDTINITNSNANSSKFAKLLFTETSTKGTTISTIDNHSVTSKKIYTDSATSGDSVTTKEMHVESTTSGVSVTTEEIDVDITSSGDSVTTQEIHVNSTTSEEIQIDSTTSEEIHVNSTSSGDSVTTEEIHIDSTTSGDSITTKKIYVDLTTIGSSLLPEDFSSSTEYATSTTEEDTTEGVSETEVSHAGSSISTDLNAVTEKSSTEYRITSNTEEDVTTEATTEVTDSTTWKTTQNYATTHESMTMSSDQTPEEPVCMTGECKNIGSGILFYMNHTVEPCDDFYEYACGGFVAHPLTVDRNLKNDAYQRILRQLMKEYRHDKSPLFNKFYKSCLAYENVNFTERIQLARKTLDEVGRFYTADEWARNHTSFTELLAKLLLHNSPLLFDLSPALNENFPEHFTLKIGPTTYKSPFDTDDTADPCYENQSLEREQETVVLERLYEEYKTCKNDTKKFIRSISEALSDLGIFSELNDSYSISQYIDTTVINIDHKRLQKFFADDPSKSEIREEYASKNYTLVTIEELDKSYKIVNWTQLIYLLTNAHIKPEAMVQVYFYQAFVQGLKNLEKFGAEDPMTLNNALLGLYARNLYHDLVLSKHRDPKEHCLHVAANLLVPEASSLYMSSFSDAELARMSSTTKYLFEEVKETLKMGVEQSQWIGEDGRSALIAKIENMKLSVPDISYFSSSDSTYRRHKANEVTLTDNYFENSVALMRRNRMLMYAEFSRNPGHPEQIWTHYATPFQSKGLAIYGLNLVVIPFGVIDWSTVYDHPSFEYITLATLGNVIAHQIARHFDTNGIRYHWNGTRDANYILSDKDDDTTSYFNEYIDCQRKILYQNPMEMTLPSTGQTVSYKIPELTLNERLSETVGLRLAYHTLDRLRSRKEVLPWLKLDSHQLFYLTYAQTHCTKSPLTSSYISLYEDEELPSSIRVFVSASNDRFLGQAWNCRMGSQLFPSTACNAFPYNQYDEESGIDEQMS